VVTARAPGTSNLRPARLERSPPAGISQRAAASTTAATGAGTSSVHRQLISVVERSSCEGDRRGIYVVLTEAGEQRHAEAAPTHRGVLARTLPAVMLAPSAAGE